jgi:hypothetical protein
MTVPVDKILEIASHIFEPIPASTFAVGCLLVFLLLNSGLKPRTNALLRLAVKGIMVLGAAPLAVYFALAWRGVYHVQVTVLDPHKVPVHEADVSATVGQKKQTDLGWEFDIPPQEKPQGNTVTFYASAKDAYLAGQASIRLGGNFSPDVVIELSPMQQVDVIGNVQGRDGKAVVGATVSVIGYPDQATTDSMGSFRLGSHAADGQMVTIRIKKGALQGQYTIPAGKASTVNLI